jgi:4-diphosphocytidyl-2-C-methyl-D-erythritol kinase
MRVSVLRAAMVKLVAERAVAKINLFLRVVGRRPDGYHQLDSIFLPVLLADEVRLELRTPAERSVRLICDAPALGDEASNLASRAARAFLDEFKIDASVLIQLEKRIPVGAGLGGGSSDAGAVLRMMSRLARIDAPTQLATIAVKLGADVPFFLDPKPARVGGIGEVIEPLAGFPSIPLVLAIPSFGIATASVFKGLTPQDWSGRAPESDVAAASRGEITQAIAVNDLAVVAEREHREVGELRTLLNSLGARAAQMTGSGSAVFGVFASTADAERAASPARVDRPDTTFIVTESRG